MDLVAEYLRDFNREYLSTVQDRRFARQIILEGTLLVALILVSGLLLRLWQG